MKPAVLITVFGLASHLALYVLFLHAFRIRRDIFDALFQVTTQKISFLVILSIAGFYAYLSFKLFCFIFFGDLKQRDTDAVKKTFFWDLFDLLPFVYFQSSFSTFDITVIVIIVLARNFGNLLDSKIKYLHESPNAPYGSYCRIALGLLLLLGTSAFIYAQFGQKSQNSSALDYLFCLESLKLASLGLVLVTKFAVGCYDFHFKNSVWEYRQLADLLTTTTKRAVDCILLVLCMYFLYTKKNMVIFIHFISVVTMFAKFVNSATDVYKYFKLQNKISAELETIKLNEHPELDNTCVICREEMIEGKRLPCGHIIHESCIRSWLAVQSVCPMCQKPILESAMQNEFGEAQNFGDEQIDPEIQNMNNYFQQMEEEHRQEQEQNESKSSQQTKSMSQQDIMECVMQQREIILALLESNRELEAQVKKFCAQKTEEQNASTPETVHNENITEMVDSAGSKENNSKPSFTNRESEETSLFGDSKDVPNEVEGKVQRDDSESDADSENEAMLSKAELRKRRLQSLQLSQK